MRIVVLCCMARRALLLLCMQVHDIQVDHTSALRRMTGSWLCCSPMVIGLDHAIASIRGLALASKAGFASVKQADELPCCLLFKSSMTFGSRCQVL